MVIPRARARAFTLVELLVALLLGSMIMLMVVSTVRATVAFTEAANVAERDDRRDDRIRALLASQLAWLEVDRDGQPRLFFGAHDRMQFGTLVSASAPERREPVTVEYRAFFPSDERVGASLLYHESAGRTTIPVDDASARSGVAPGERPVLDGLETVELWYLRYESSGLAVWDPDWLDPGALPRAVRITIRTAGGQERSWVVPIVATF